MKKILLTLAVILMTAHSGAALTNHFKTKQVQHQLLVSDKDDDDDDFWKNLDKEKIEENVKEIWKKHEEQTLEDVLLATEAYFFKRNEQIKDAVAHNRLNYFLGIRILNQAYFDLDNIRQKGFFEFFKPQKREMWDKKFSELFDKWEKKFTKIKNLFDEENDDKKFNEFSEFENRVEKIEKLFQKYIKKGKIELTNHNVGRDIATEKDLEDLIKQYDITLRDFGRFILRKNIQESKVSLKVFRQYLNLSQMINTELENMLKEFVTVFLENVKARIDTLNKELDKVKNDDAKFEDFEKLHIRYLAYKEEAEFLNTEKLFERVPVILIEVNRLVLDLRKHFTSAGQTMSKAFKSHFDRLLKTIQVNATTPTSEDSWQALEAATEEFKKSHKLYKEMKADDGDLNLNSKDIDGVINDIGREIEVIKFTGIDKITVDRNRDGYYFQVSQNTWYHILGYGHAAGSATSAIVGTAGARKGFTNFGNKTFQVFGKTIFKAGSKFGRFVGASLGGLFTAAIGFILLELPFVRLQNAIQTTGTGGTFFISKEMFAAALALLPLFPLMISETIIKTFEIQPDRMLDLFEKEE